MSVLYRSKMIETDTTFNLKTERIKLKQQGDDSFMHGVMDTDTGTGIVKNMVRKFEVLGGQESGFSLTPRKEYNFTSASHLAEQQSVESPSKRLRLTKPGTSEPPATPASTRASPAWGPVSGRGRSRPSRSTSSPSCRRRRPVWPPASADSAKQAALAGWCPEGSRGTAR